MKPKTVQLDSYVSLETSFKYGQVEIHFGKSFYLSKHDRKLQLNRTPNGEPKLVPIDRTILSPGSLQIDAIVRDRAQSFDIHFESCPFGAAIAKFVYTFINNELDFANPHTHDVSFSWEPPDFSFTLAQQNGPSIYFFYPYRRAGHLYRRSDGQLRPDLFCNVDLAFDGETVSFSGTPEHSTETGPVEWKLDEQDPMHPLITELLWLCVPHFQHPESKWLNTHENASKQAPAVEPPSDVIQDSTKSQSQHLEELIAQEKTLGEYHFDESEQCFFTDVEVVLYITRIKRGKYRMVCYFFDGYEVYLEEDEADVFSGNEASARQQAIDSFNSETFMGYPIVYQNITCSLYEDEAE